MQYKMLTIFLLLICWMSWSVAIPVTSMTTTYVPAENPHPSSDNYSTPPAPGSPYFLGSYNVEFGHVGNLAVNSFTTSSGIVGSGSGTLADSFSIQRSGAVASSNIVWYEYQNAAAANPTIELAADRIIDNNSDGDLMDDALLSSVINRGSDNVFDNTATSSNDIERLDFVFTQGIEVTNNTQEGFLVLDRGRVADADLFGAAAITGINGSNQPTGYNTLASFGDPSGLDHQQWGDSVSSISTLVFRSGPLPDDTPSPAANIKEDLRAIFITFEELSLYNGDTFYGYSLFPGDVTDTNDLLGMTDFDLTGTSGNFGGLDLVGGGGVRLLSTPEPSSIATLCLLGITCLLGSYFRRKKTK